MRRLKSHIFILIIPVAVLDSRCVERGFPLNMFAHHVPKYRWQTRFYLTVAIIKDIPRGISRTRRMLNSLTSVSP